jgi:TonB family protein
MLRQAANDTLDVIFKALVWGTQKLTTQYDRSVYFLNSLFTFNAFMFMRFIITLVILFISIAGFCQKSKIIGAVMTDDNGITNDQKKAKFLVVEKQVNDTTFEKLTYNFAGPMIERATFLEKDLKTLNGQYADYHSNGYLATAGQYVNNKKDGIWYIYDDTSKAITKYKFHLDSLISKTDMDSLAKANKDKIEDTTGEREAVYKGGTDNIRKIISSNFKVPNRTSALKISGTVKVRFVVNTTGSPVDIAILHSVEFAFDEEALRVISYLKNWTPAFQRGHNVNAYRIQPITIAE